ncbi:mannose-1-phosphate guanylyltransferase [Abyssalbus ytuae]|uniref:mannose-1-phosphate guanylyltransferase n=1 Tax=Abyssalbus ytuae TaxID=2926907 RepID=A0A9E7D448_9FLAO|nr:mannose-1-phosphate guanylyltransferase [Abyssalbus ytuae]UOB18519.1 mannose-1-phosphate guanylyltransferase [Abyssalbus ytuae]
MNKNYYAVLMAGGVGSRFWPVSKTGFPKQFHDMLGTGETLIQRTFKRLNKIVPAENILILTNERYNELVLEQLPQITAKQVVLEPEMRNTAPCILYASLKIYKENPDAVMIVAPSDHWIEDEEAFINNVEKCFKAAHERKGLFTLGIKPTFPSTGYGYIKFENSSSPLKKVDKFTEKPDYDTAKSFLSTGMYLWNAGIFMWSVKIIIEAFEKFQPQMYHLFSKGEEFYNTGLENKFIEENYAKAENISIDYAILEHSDDIYVLSASFDWNDLGAWGALYNELEKDKDENAVVNSRPLLIESSGNIIRTSNNKVVVIEGLKDFVVVETDDVMMICPRNKEQNVKSYLQQVKQKYGEELT